MADLAELGIVVRSDGVLVAADRLGQLEQAAKKTEGATGALEKTFGGVASHVAKLAAEVYGAFKAVELLKEALFAAAHERTMEVSMRKVGENAGYTMRQLEGTRDAIAKYGMTVGDATEALTKMVAQNMSLAESETLAARARDISISKGVASHEVLNAMTMAIETGNVRMLRQYDIFVNQEMAMRRYADAVGKSTLEFTDHDRQQAMLHETLRKTTNYLGVAAETQDLVTRRLGAMKRAWKEMLEALGDTLQTGSGSAIGAITELLEDLQKLLKDDTIRKGLEGIAIVLGKIVSLLAHIAAAIPSLIGSFDKIGTVQEAIRTGQIKGPIAMFSRAELDKQYKQATDDSPEGIARRMAGVTAMLEQVRRGMYGNEYGPNRQLIQELEATKALLEQKQRVQHIESETERINKEAAARGQANREQAAREEQALIDRKLAAQRLAQEKAAVDAEHDLRIARAKATGDAVAEQEAVHAKRVYDIRQDLRIALAKVDMISGEAAKAQAKARADLATAEFEHEQNMIKARITNAERLLDIWSRMSNARGAGPSLGVGFLQADVDAAKAKAGTTDERRRAAYDAIRDQTMRRLVEDMTISNAQAQATGALGSSQAQVERFSSVSQFNIELRQSAKLAQVQAEELSRVLELDVQIRQAERDIADEEAQRRDAAASLSAAQLAELDEEISRRRMLLAILRNQKQDTQAAATAKIRDTESERNALTGLTDGWNKYYDDVSNHAKNAGTVFTNTMRGVEDALFQFFDKGEIGWKQFGALVRAELIKMYVREAVVSPFMAASKSLWTALLSANGNAFGPGGVLALANGGVVDSPTAFTYGGGKLGVMGESGPEAVVPLVRGADGKLGVGNKGGGAPISVSVEFVNQSSTPLKQKGPATVRWNSDFREAVATIVVEDLTNGGPIRNAMGG